MKQLDIEEQRDAKICELARAHADATKTNVMNSNSKVLHDLSNALGDRLNHCGVSELLIHAALCCGPLTAGQMLIDLIQKCIDADAETEALVEVERMKVAAANEPENCRHSARMAVTDCRHVIRCRHVRFQPQGLEGLD